MNPATPVTLIAGAPAALRESAVAAAIVTLVGGRAARSTGSAPAISIVVVLEGLPGGQDPIAAAAALIERARIQIIRIAPGCPCCSGNLTMRVTLNRILRHPPQALYIGLASAQHLTAFRQFLTQAPYDQLLQLNQDIMV